MIRFRNSTIDPRSPVEEWGYGNVLTAATRGGLAEWRRLLAAAERAPYGAVAHQLGVAVTEGWSEAPDSCRYLRDRLADIRADHDTTLAGEAGRRIRAARRAAGLTQAQLAARVGMARPLLSDYERGAVQPTLPVLLRLEAAAGSAPAPAPASGAVRAPGAPAK